ncbi:response regulator [Methylobacterium soli]|uniref:response regulator n=1 Tax=Methylobacterium soli TaxID=553447 RepID=UPI0017844B01|nr:response regulator [Methylobacterium soli]
MASETEFRPIAILVVDQDRVIRIVTSDTLEDAGFRAIEAGDAQEAIRALERHADVRLMIAGHTLPGSLDGIRLARLVHDRWPNIGIIVTSGGMNLSACELPVGTRLLRKPYPFDELLCAVDGLIGSGDAVGEGAPVLPEGIPMQTTLGVAIGGSNIAGPAPEADRT